jgi:4-amino-4-deoxy-L-arabinose transferase-like glycosyltransferase
MTRFFPRIVDGVLLLLAAVYVLLGAADVPFHGDEGMQVYATTDFFTAFVDGHPAALMTTPPYPIDSPQQLRLINGSVQRYTAGAVLHLNGHNTGDLPNAPGWNWGLPYAANVDGGWLPKDSVLHKARWTSAAFFALGLLPMFGLGGWFGGRPAAYAAVVLTALHPVLLLNVRRAMMEGSLLAFALLTAWAAVWLVRRWSSDGDARGAWGLLTVAAGLTLASKHSGALVLVGVWGGLLASVWTLSARRWRRVGALLASGLTAIALFVALSPALWSNPPARLLDLARARTDLLEIQTAIEADAPMPFIARVGWPFAQAYAAPVYSERADWYADPTLNAAMAAYEQNGLAGVRGGALLSGVVVALTVIGLAVRRDRALLILAGWLLLGVLLLLSNPLPWQRYYLPLMPAWTLGAGVGVSVLWERIARAVGRRG